VRNQSTSKTRKPAPRACQCPVCADWTPMTEKAVEMCTAGERVEFNAFFCGSFIGSYLGKLTAQIAVDSHKYELIRRGLYFEATPAVMLAA
jgi:hypothetical protein